MRDANESAPLRWRLPLWLSALCLWMLPLVAMHYTTEVQWDAIDFAAFGAMLAGVCLAWEIALRASGAAWDRFASLSAIGIGFFEVWVNLAVGIVGSEQNPFNLSFFGVLLVAILRTSWVRVRPSAMVSVMLGTALAQGLIGLLALSMLGRAALPALLLSALWLVPAWFYSRSRD